MKSYATKWILMALILTVFLTACGAVASEGQDGQGSGEQPPVAVVKAREAFEQGRLGKLVMGTVRLRWRRDQKYYDSEKWRGTWAYDGGVFTNQASHHIDMLTWFLGPVESISAALAATPLKHESRKT